jgi:uncharacterized membrane protein YbaN (DUF454 family)
MEFLDPTEQKTVVSFEVVGILVLLFFIVPYLLTTLLCLDKSTDKHLQMITNMYRTFILVWVSAHIIITPIG